MSQYTLSFLRSLPGVETIGDDVLYGQGRERRLLGRVEGTGVKLTPDGIETVQRIKPVEKPKEAAKNVDELFEYAYTAFGVKLDKRKNIQTLQQQVAELEQEFRAE